MGESSTIDFKNLAPQFLEAVRSARNVVVGSHLNPDGDALGSALAMSGALGALGVKHDILMHHRPPANLQFLKGLENIKYEIPEGRYDLAIVLDLEALDRLGSVQDAFRHAATMVVIDHHQPTESPGDIRIVSTAYPATSSILVDLFAACQVPVDSAMAECLATGILTDTGNFRYQNTTARSLHQVAQMVELGADIARVSEEVYMRRTLASTRLNGFTLSTFKLAEAGQIAYASVPCNEFERVSGSDEDTEGFVSELLGIQGVEAAFLLRESRPGSIRGSLRSRGDVDVAAAARQFGGGGHRNAAGVSFEGSLAEAEELLLVAIKSALESQ